MSDVAPSLIAADVLADAAFQLLASSTITRYERVAREIAERAGLVAIVRDNPEASVARAFSLWYEVALNEEREPAEIELALLLVALADARPPGAETLLAGIAAYGAGGASPWSVGLARRLLGPFAAYRAMFAAVVGLGNCDPADRLRDVMDTLWYQMSDAERAKCER